MMENKNYYSILGVDKKASEDDIKRAYKKLAMKYHPDRHVSDSEEDKKKAEDAFKEANEAYNVLSDKNKRANYDLFGSADGIGGNSSGFNPFGGFNFGGFGRQAPVKEKGEDLHIDVSATLSEIFYGSKKTVKIKKKCTCHRCHGSGSEDNDSCTCPKCGGSGVFVQTTRFAHGYSQQMMPCPDCHGTGTIIKNPCECCHGTGLEEKETDVQFFIPPGIPNGATFISQSNGNDGPHRGVMGDLFVTIHETPSENGLTRDAAGNLSYILKMKYPDMIFGKDASIPMIDGNTRKIHIEAGTESGKRIKLYRQGFPVPNTFNEKTDYIITVECDIPKESELTEEQKEIISKL